MMRLAAQAYRPSSAINAYGIGRWTTVRRPSEIVTHARQPESLRDRGQDGCEHERLIAQNGRMRFLFKSEVPYEPTQGA